ncbi:glycosyltransferase family 2 protein [Martelella limonii]|uniref:glycosyltransferase family 2 protein n=1 Tax=Martelella limonii TaxID=1647649 RepID=UPI0019D5299B|nr:glycosyltransferase family 2 protein [Martelella limonii]
MNEPFNVRRARLSILIPTYRYAAGLERILSVLAPLPDDVEVLVFDDSPEPDLQAIIARFAKKMPRLSYRHNPTHSGASLGAGANWNALLEASSGEYVLLMHHDEVPLDRDFLDLLRERLSRPDASDAYMLDLMLVDEELRPIRRHTPRWMRRFVPGRTPTYLFRRNVIGPTGTMVIRRSVLPRFDPTLRWLIDVDFYVQLFQQNIDWMFEPDIRIGSVQRSEGSITASLSGRLGQIDAAERRMLAGRYPKARLWLGAPMGAPIRWMETLAWGVLRTGMRLMSRMNVS